MAPQYAEIVDLLIEGARYGDEEDVDSALQQGADVNAQDEQGRTALHMAAANGHIELLKRLIDSGAAVGISNIEGNTALHWACVNHQLEAARLLLQAGASASALNRHDMTPVDEALIREYQDIVDFINGFNAPSKGGGEEEEDDIPEDAEDAGEEGDMLLDD